MSTSPKVNEQKDSKSLHSAIELGNVGLLKSLLNQKLDINHPNENHETPLHIAIKTGQNKRIVRYLIQKGADINIKDDNGLNSLHLAAHSGNVSLVRIILKHTSTIDEFTDNANRETALHLASRAGHEKVIRCLLAHGADINKKTDNESGLTALHHSSAFAKTTKLLLDSGISVNSLDNLNNNALHKACTYGYKKAAQVLVDYKIDVNAVNSMNSTALDTIYNVIWRIRRRGWFVNPGSYPEETAIILIKVLTLKLLSKQHVNDLDLKLLNSQELKGLYYQCEKEIEKMTNTSIFEECTISFFDILSRNEKSIAKILNNDNVLKKLESGQFGKEFPIYAKELESRMKRAKEIHEFMEISAHFLNSVTKNIFPAFIVNEILSYINIEELERLK